MKTCAFFDVDYTILSKSSMLLYAQYMRKKGEYKLWEIALGMFYLAQYKLNLLDFEAVTERVTRRYEGMSEKEMIDTCERWFEEQVRHYIYPEIYQVIDEHRARGDELCILSAITEYLARPLARHLGINHWLCNQMEVVDGRFTGRLKKPFCYGKGKLEYARRFAEENRISLKDSYYYSDSITDLEVLSAFGHPVAVNPDPLLRKEAQRRGWKILESRSAGKKKKAVG